MEYFRNGAKSIARLTYTMTAAAAIAAILAGCSQSSTADATAAGAVATVDGNVSTPPASGSRLASAAPGAVASVAGRELVNPDASTVVFLYYQLAHLPLPIDTWVQEDNRVKFAPAPDKAERREAVRSELNAAAASVQGVGSLRLTMNANLSEYDPSYGEFTIRALSPSSVVNFDALGQKVAVSFTNGRTAQIWHVPQADAQAVRDKISYNSNVEVDVLLKIANVLPGPGGGTIATDVVEYELRETQRGAVLARVRLDTPQERK
ncbi:MAG: hypothetical protein WDO68_28460 [Gammaproteobacteria bacterium]